MVFDYGERGPAGAHRTDLAYERLKKLYHSYGCSQIAIPLLLAQDTAMRYYPRGSEGFVKLVDTNGVVQFLRADATLNVLASLKDVPPSEPFRVYYMTEIASYGGEGILESLQTGVEFLNDPSPLCDAQLIRLALDSLRELGVEGARIDFGHGDFIEALLDEVPGLEERDAQEAHMLFSRKNARTLAEFLEMRGASRSICAAAVRICSLYGPVPETLPPAKDVCLNERMRNALDELGGLHSILAGQGDGDCAYLDLSFSNRMRYYSGVIFKAYTSEARQAVINGGRYDHFASAYSGASGACGFGHSLDATLPVCRIPDPGQGTVRMSACRGDEARAGLLADRLRRAGYAVALSSSVATGARYGGADYSLETLEEALL